MKKALIKILGLPGSYKWARRQMLKGKTVWHETNAGAVVRTRCEVWGSIGKGWEGKEIFPLDENDCTTWKLYDGADPKAFSESHKKDATCKPWRVL